MRWLDNITDSNGHEFEQTPIFYFDLHFPEDD